MRSLSTMELAARRLSFVRRAACCNSSAAQARTHDPKLSTSFPDGPTLRGGHGKFTAGS